MVVAMASVVGTKKMSGTHKDKDKEERISTTN